MAATLERQLELYAQFHKNNVNKWIHKICIPLAIFTFNILAPSIAYNITMFLMVYYLFLDIRIGFVCSLIYGILYFVSFVFRDVVSFWNVVVIHITCWGIQIYGHKYHEKNQPALLTNLVNSMIIAPLYVVYPLIMEVWTILFWMLQ